MFRFLTALQAELVPALLQSLKSDNLFLRGTVTMGALLHMLYSVLIEFFLQAALTFGCIASWFSLEPQTYHLVYEEATKMMKDEHLFVRCCAAYIMHKFISEGSYFEHDPFSSLMHHFQKEREENLLPRLKGVYVTAILLHSSNSFVLSLKKCGTQCSRAAILRYVTLSYPSWKI